MDHKKLMAWTRAMTFVETIYSFTSQLPKSENLGLKDQMRRSAVSIPSNIAEGSSKKSHREISRFLYIALASSSELETQIILCRSLFSLPTEALEQELSEIRRLIMGLKNYIEKSAKK